MEPETIRMVTDALSKGGVGAMAIATFVTISVAETAAAVMSVRQS